MVFDSRTEDPLVVVGSDFFLVVISDTSPQECGDIIRFYSKVCCADDLIIKGLQVLWLFKHDISGRLNLLDCPGVTHSETVCNRAVTSGKSIKDFVKVFRVDPVREFLCCLNISDFKESIIVQ